MSDPCRCPYLIHDQPHGTILGPCTKEPYAWDPGSVEDRTRPTMTNEPEDGLCPGCRSKVCLTRWKTGQRNVRRAKERPAFLSCPICIFHADRDREGYRCRSCGLRFRFPLAQLDKPFIRRALRLPRLPKLEPPMAAR